MPLSLPSRRACMGAVATTLAALAAPALLPAAMAADAWPSKPITLVVGYPAGGSTDLVGRLIGAELSNRLGQPVVIENLGGAGGAIGAQKVAKAAPDGYTLLVGANNELAIAPLVNKAIRYKPGSDFTPVGLIASQPQVLVASPKAGVKTAAEFIKLVAAHPGKYSYGSSGVGTALHLSGEMIQESAGLKMVHVPYKGVAPLTSDLVGSNLEFGVFTLSSGLPHIRAGKVIALGTTEAKRSPAAPDIPALAELPQLKGVDINSWFALMGPAGLSQPIVARLQAALKEALQTPEFRQKLEATGNMPAAASVGDMGHYLAAETAKYKKIVEAAKIKD